MGARASRIASHLILDAHNASAVRFSNAFWSFPTAHNGFACALVSREAEETVFHGADAVEPPISVGDGLDAFGFD